MFTYLLSSSFLSLALLLLVLPRTAVAYVGYLAVTPLIARFSNKTIAYLFAFVAGTYGLFVANWVQGVDVSITGYLIEVALMLGIVIYISLQPGIIEKNAAIGFIRKLNAVIFVLSIFTLILRGFPLALPYIHYSPDYYAALFGLGGAKIVTVIGFFGIATELSVGKQRKRLALSLALLNFVVPNYMIGIFCGVTALAIVYFRPNRYFIVGIFVAIFAAFSLVDRLSSINSMFAESFGAHPKIVAYLSVLELYVQYPSTFLLGTGLGQFASTSALWASDHIAEVARQNMPSLPGYHMSAYHDVVLGRYLSIGAENVFSISSSFNKPYTSVGVLMAELGLPAAIAFLCMIAKRLIFPISKPAMVIALFVGGLFAIDLWHDNLWLIALLVVFDSIRKNRRL